MSRGDDGSAPEDHPFGAHDTLAEPRAEELSKVDGTAVGADYARSCRLGDLESTIGKAVDEVEREDAIESVERESLPQLSEGKAPDTGGQLVD